jgi:UDP-N-acetylglucosamine 2-epimerase
VQQITGLDVVHVEAGRQEPQYKPVPEKREGDALGLFKLRSSKSR